MKQIFMLVLIVLHGIGSAAAETLIHAGRLIDVDAGRAYNDQTIIIDGDTISGVESGFVTPSDGDTVIDLRQSTVLPGLMDTHVHLTGQYSASSNLNRFVLNASKTMPCRLAVPSLSKL